MLDSVPSVSRSHNSTDWDSRHFLQSAELPEVYPGLEKFCRLRNSADPGGGVFTNAPLDRVLQPREVAQHST
ncbi:D-arabinono-1,4-lactone oxidase [Psychromicrobium silvestre]|uniref:D-arabinono-1,4-lactone oxidase n=1 Tax=Psychromicrobium silvestre TaxID=1645614 RepID=UPI003CCE1DA8